MLLDNAESLMAVISICDIIKGTTEYAVCINDILLCKGVVDQFLGEQP